VVHKHKLQQTKLKTDGVLPEEKDFVRRHYFGSNKQKEKKI